ncbi:hypothetical protein [Mucisphaera sp.]|uniref:hypothetical protein n=1 Tax=Mucisphaera sp. TaxID=2913024 RepID=UPI003D0AEA74
MTKLSATDARNDLFCDEPSLAQRFRWLGTRALLRPLVRWRPIEAPLLGYTLVMGATRGLMPLIDLHLRLIERQDRTGLEEILVVVDGPLQGVRDEVTGLRERWSHLPVRFVGYGLFQSLVLDAIGWSKCYSWASWTIGLSKVRSRHVLLHDFDAFLLEPDFLRQRHQLIRGLDAVFLGVERYRHPPVLASDGLVGTWEMMLDAAWVRRRARPIDVFNVRSEVGGRRVDLDTFHALQARAGAVFEPASVGALVHATQMICQAGQVERQGGCVAPRNMTTPLIPYLYEAAGQSGAMKRAVIEDRSIYLLGQRVGLAQLTRDRVHGLRTMASAIDRVLVGKLRPEAEAYFDRLDAVAVANESNGGSDLKAAA